MRIEDYDWKIGDFVRVTRRDFAKEYTGEIIGIGLKEKSDGESYFIYGIKISDKEGIAARTSEMQPLLSKYEMLIEKAKIKETKSNAEIEAISDD